MARDDPGACPSHQFVKPSLPAYGGDVFLSIVAAVDETVNWAQARIQADSIYSRSFDGKEHIGQDHPLRLGVR